MLGTFPTKHSRVNLPDLISTLSRTPSQERICAKEEATLSLWGHSSYALVCYLYALGPSLLDIFLSRLCKVRVKSVLVSYGWSDEGHLFAYLYALTVSAYAFTKCGSAPFTGFLSDKLGRRKMLTFTLMATGVMLLLTGYCTSWIGLLICRFVTGLFSNGGLLTAHAADIAVSIEDRTTLFSYFITAWAFARVTAAYIFPLVGEDVGVCCWAACVCEFLAAALLWGSSEATDQTKSGKSGGQHAWRARTLLRHPMALLRDRPSFRTAFREMMRDRLVASLFVTSLLMPRIDIAAYLWQKFKQGPSAVGYIKAIESMTVILVPLTPIISMLTGKFGHAGAAVGCAAAMSLCWIVMVDVTTMNELYTMVLLRCAISTIYEPSIKSIIMESKRAQNKEHVGSYSGLQQTMKGAAQVMGSFWGSFLASQDWSAFTPLYFSALWCGANAAIIFLFCCSSNTSRRDPPTPSKSKHKAQ